MDNKWRLYDELITGISPDATVEDFIVGCAWTGVKTNGEWGIALTVRGRAMPFDESSLQIGMPLREMAEHVKSWNFIEASIGMAAINAWYNAPGRVAALGILPKDDTARGQKSNVFEAAAPEVAGKNVTVIGHFPHVQKQLGDICKLSILEREPQNGDYPDSACEYILPEQDYVFITGMTLTNKTLPRLLELCKGHAKVYLVGPSVPLSPALIKYGVSNYSAFTVTDPEMLSAKLRCGAKQSIFRSGHMLMWDGNAKNAY